MNKFDIKLKRISYIVNNTCNLSCSYCFQNKSKRHNISLNPLDALKATQFAINNNKSESQEIEITLIGGEPSLYDKYLELESSFNFIKNKNYKISILRVFTNGLVINNQMIELLNKFQNIIKNITFFITEDFFQSHQLKINHKNDDNFNIIKNNVKNLKLMGFNVVSQYIFTPNHVLEYEDILNLLYENKDIKIDYAYPSKNDFTYNHFKHMINTIIKFSKSHKLDFDFYQRAGMELLYIIEHNGKLVPNKINTMHTLCDPIKGEFSISPKGYIIPCVKLLEIEDKFKDFHINNINNDFFYNNFILKFINYHDKNYENCSCDKCIFDKYCHTCRLFVDYVDLNKPHIEHPLEKCDRMNTLINCIIDILKEELWEQ